MPDEAEVTFEDLLTYRQRLQRFCSRHYDSLIRFKDGVSFKLNSAEAALGPDARHLSSTATCIESLLDCPKFFRANTAIDVSTLARDFGVSALKRPHEDWLSDESARVYCRCRTLPLIVNCLPGYQDVLCEHLEWILWQLKQDSERLAVGEASEKDPNPDNWYPPNAFHTYWTLYLLLTLEQRFSNKFAEIRTKFKESRFDIDRLRAEMLVWARQIAGYQTALHASESFDLDSDQLAWSLAIMVKFGRDFQTNLARQDFIRYAFKCLFEHQSTSGIWRRGAPLFHYPLSGNAYCYVFETFTVLVKAVLTTRKEGHFLREVIYPYTQRLLDLWNYAELTQIPSGNGNTLGWSSGHRVNHTEAESWATASVFAFSQAFRRLIGTWARETSALRLRVSSTHEPKSDATKKLLDRGDTWAKPNRTAATQLMTLFVNPIRCYESEDNLEPDAQPISENQARGAILFGPPGTSKTTLCRAVADAVGWDYIELHASDFVAEGLPNVQRKADTIFKQLLQLDHTVILFDEIDELVRAREKEHDAFGRFLTTSMLPKLAELWKRRKVIYFVATNYIRFFDPAVTRAQRFDALIHVAPPSFDRKIQRIISLLKANSIDVESPELTRDDVEKTLQDIARIDDKDKRETPLPTKDILAKFLLMRWDQIDELVATIKQRQRGKSSVRLTRKLVADSLADVADPFLTICRPFKDFLESRKYEGHDFSMLSLWEVTGDIPEDIKPRVFTRNGRNWYNSDSAFGDIGAFSEKCRIKQPGLIDCSETKATSNTKSK